MKSKKTTDSPLLPNPVAGRSSFLRNRRIVGWLPLLFLLLGAGVLGAVRDNRFGGDIVWTVNYKSGIREAQDTGKLILISFRAPGCGWCAKMDSETFSDPALVELSHRFVCVRQESDVDAFAFQLYRVDTAPQFIIADSHGRLLRRIRGFVPADRLLPLLRVFAANPPPSP